MEQNAREAGGIAMPGGVRVKAGMRVCDKRKRFGHRTGEDVLSVPFTW